MRLIGPRRMKKQPSADYFNLFASSKNAKKKDKDLAEPVVLSEENAVRVMTIHASKGLEFPVVFVLDMTKRI